MDDKILHCSEPMDVFSDCAICQVCDKKIKLNDLLKGK